MKIKEHNIELGEVVERDMTPEELSQLETDKTEAAANAAAKAANAAAKAELLTKLGITEDEAKLLLS